ncbi:uncharacterized protein LOC107635055 isoform X2 [Arachis ipaensis]|uniref:uncharacterized protein LOC107635055 isoform X2 n=1 Tax=Arachis ipaensis TaxID=130454 RepID=UPI000A2B550D|nr:uncharacterized protein LOC107635055 isoform X2 [Arachis ipaensis]XP_029148160.1 uncharacterized protein LOC112744182 isoform X2 [Arachis hypogaea]
MKISPKDSTSEIFLQTSSWSITKLMGFFFLIISISSLTILTHSSYNHQCSHHPTSMTIQISDPPSSAPPPLLLSHQQTTTPTKQDHHQPIVLDDHKSRTNLSHIVFGIGATSKFWNHRKQYIKLWWRPNVTRGNVWLDQKVQIEHGEDSLLPTLRVSSDTSKFKYNHPNGHRSGIRLSRIVSETVRLKMKNVRWFVMGDDDTVFVTENLVKVLQKYDHNEFYYIGSSSESHMQNIYFSYNMAFGGGGFAISYSLALALEKMQDRCIQRYPSLFGSDDRIQACMAELGVPLTKENGFHQFDLKGNLFGLLAAHPVTPLISLHHLDLVEPIFPNMTRVQALQRLKGPMKLDPYALMQQSICYDKTRVWTISVSWGYAVQIFRGIFLPRDVELPATTFSNWNRKADHNAFPFSTRPSNRNVCQKPFVFYFSNVTYDGSAEETISDYIRIDPNPDCRWKIPGPTQVRKIEVFKKLDPHIWEKECFGSISLYFAGSKKKLLQGSTKKGGRDSCD